MAVASCHVFHFSETLFKLECFLETKERTNYRVLSDSSGCVTEKAVPTKALFNLPPIALRSMFASHSREVR